MNFRDKDKDKDKDKQEQDNEKPTNDLVFCYEAIVTFNEIIEKLNYIGKYTSSNSEGVMSKAIGQQIENLMKKQQELEKEFEKEIRNKASKIELVEEDQIMKLKEQINSIALSLKQSTNNLCKSLAENPDIPKNLKKAIFDKDKIKDKILIIQQELVDGSFDAFKKMSQDFKDNNINIQELRNKEMELFKELREINEKLAIEESEYLKESKTLNYALNTSKKELAKSRMEEDILREYRKNDLLALEELKLYDFNQEKQKFTKQILEKEREKIMEDEIFNHVANYLRETKEKVKKEIGDWNKNVNEKNKVVDDKKQKLEKRKENKNKKIEETQIESNKYATEIKKIQVKKEEPRRAYNYGGLN